MKKFKLRFFIVTAILISALGFAKPTYAYEEVILIRTIDDHIEENEYGNRMPTRPIHCTIDIDGVSIQGMDVDDIVLYEVYDMNSDCLMSTSIQSEFTLFVMSSSSDIEIRLHTSQFVLKGFIQH